MLILKSFTTWVHDRSIVPASHKEKLSYHRYLKVPFTFITRLGFHTLTLAHMLDSLVRVSRRDGSLHFAKVPNSKRLLLSSIAQINCKHSMLSKQSLTRDDRRPPRHVVGTSVLATATSMPRYNNQTQVPEIPP